MRDLELDEHLGLDADQLVTSVQQRRLVVLLEPLRGIADGFGRDGHLLERVVVHEVEIGTVVVEVLQLLRLETHGFNLDAGVERVIDDAAGLDVAQLRADEGAALAGLHMLELDDGAQLAVKLDAHAVLEIGGRDSHTR